jgi:hypothetical protein
MNGGSAGVEATMIDAPFHRRKSPGLAHPLEVNKQSQAQ